MLRWYYRVLAIVVVLGTTSLAVAQTGTIRGTVSDQVSQEALVGANVILTGTAMGASTDVRGKFVITNVPAGQHSLTVRMVGYE